MITRGTDRTAILRRRLMLPVVERLRIGIVHAPTDRGMPPQDVARAVEDRGFHSLFIPEHTHIPVSARSPWPGDGTMPASAPRQHDLMVALTAAALATTRLRVGSAVCLLPQHDTISAAKAFASIDTLSGGRLAVGVGIGWNVEELRNHGVEPATRHAKLDEQIPAMRALWTMAEAAYDGRFVSFEPSWSWPKPEQPRLPVLIGARLSPRTLATIIEHGDGWIPFPGPQLAADIRALRTAWHNAGRTAGPEVVVFGVAANRRALQEVESAQATAALLLLAEEKPDEIARRLDSWASLLA